ncbi:MAG: N-acetyltransferase [Cocleimonas sp.]|nr:N-acetyltransferase [Cocleimonas sp.]
MKLSLAKRDDLEGIVEIYNQAIRAGQCTADTVPFSVTEKVAWFESHTPEEFPLLVAKENNRLLGYLTLSAYREGRKAVRNTAEISYYIHYDHHRKGVASHLMHHAIKLCPSLQIHNLIAILVGCNQASINFLESHSFAQWGCFPNIVKFDKESVDHLYYGRHLEPNY